MGTDSLVWSEIHRLYGLQSRSVVHLLMLCFINPYGINIWGDLTAEGAPIVGNLITSEDKLPPSLKGFDYSLP